MDWLPIFFQFSHRSRNPIRQGFSTENFLEVHVTWFIWTECIIIWFATGFCKRIFFYQTFSHINYIIWAICILMNFFKVENPLLVSSKTGPKIDELFVKSFTTFITIDDFTQNCFKITACKVIKLNLFEIWGNKFLYLVKRKRFNFSSAKSYLESSNKFLVNYGRMKSNC